MNKLHLRRFTILITTVLLTLVAASAVAVAQEGQASDEITLVGQLYVGDAGGYILIEKQSGDVVLLKSSVDLEEFSETTVRVTGNWTQDAEGARYFLVREVQQTA